MAVGKLWTVYEMVSCTDTPMLCTAHLLLHPPFCMMPGGPLEWQEGVSGSSMDSQKAP